MLKNISEKCKNELLSLLNDWNNEGIEKYTETMTFLLNHFLETEKGFDKNFKCDAVHTIGELKNYYVKFYAILISNMNNGRKTDD